MIKEEGEINYSKLDMIFPIRKWMRDLINYKDSMQKVLLLFVKDYLSSPDQGFKLIDF